MSRLTAWVILNYHIHSNTGQPTTFFPKVSHRGLLYEVDFHLRHFAIIFSDNDDLNKGRGILKELTLTASWHTKELLSVSNVFTPGLKRGLYLGGATNFSDGLSHRVSIWEGPSYEGGIYSSKYSKMLVFLGMKLNPMQSHNKLSH